MEHIRNFCIIAHIDHGKSTLADRLLELTGTVEKRAMRDQLLDTMDLERERGITIKLQPVRMSYDFQGERYILNLIDTPGHVDFSYEVSRSLAACEGALLVVDATQGIQAQTLANLHQARAQKLTIIPVINKIDLPAANVNRTKAEISKLLSCREEEIICVSAKTGKKVEEILQAIIKLIPSPQGNPNAPLRCLIFDSIFDEYQGVVTYVRVVDGRVKKGEEILLMQKNKQTEAMRVGYFRPHLVEGEELRTGEIGYIVTGLKGVGEASVGDTVTLFKTPAQTALKGYRRVQSMVFAGLYSKDASEYSQLREALGRLKLNDAALSWEPENSPALGFGFRCGFLGLLHLDIVVERLRREFNMEVLVTTPSVAYKIVYNSGEQEIISSPLDLPDLATIEHFEEPVMMVNIITPVQYLGNVLRLVSSKRGVATDNAMEYLDEQRVILRYEIPLAGLVTDFYDSLKNCSSGYASLSYEFSRYAPADIMRLDILVAQEVVEALAMMVYREEAVNIGRRAVGKLKNILPRQLFEVKIQAALGGKIIASEKIPPLRKDVTAKLYGGDVTRKRKLLEKQKKGKKRMKSLGKVDIPQEAFFAILKR